MKGAGQKITKLKSEQEFGERESKVEVGEALKMGVDLALTGGFVQAHKEGFLCIIYNSSLKEKKIISLKKTESMAHIHGNV